MSLFAHIEMAGNAQGSVSEREASGNGPVTVHVGIAPGNEIPQSLKITVQPSGDYSLEVINSQGRNGWLSFFARGDKRTVRFRRKRITGTLKGE